MSLVFFEGFNRSFASTDPAGQWSWTSATDGSSTVTPVFGPPTWGIPVRNGSGVLYLPSLYGAGNTNQCYAELINFGTQTTKTVFLGFAANELWTGFDSATSNDPFPATLLRFYDASGTEKFRVDLAKGTAADAINISFKNAAGSTTHGTFILTGAVDGSASYSRFYGTDGNGNWPYLELKLVVNASTGSAEVRVGGLALQTSTGATSITLPAITEIGKIRFYANETGNTVIDDLYILNADGGSLNSWLGPTTKVFSPTLQTTNNNVSTETVQEWTTVGSLTLDSHNPDSDYLTTKLTNQSQFYVLNSYDNLFSISEAETVAAVMVRSIARETSLPAAYKQVFKSGTANSAVDITASAINTNAYYQSTATLLTANPATSTSWTKTDLQTAHFGIKSVARV